LSLNQYAYAQNTPVMYYDPSGHFRISVKLFAAGLSMALTGSISLGALIAYIRKRGAKAANSFFIDV